VTTFSYTGGAFSNLVGNTPGANVSNAVQLFNDLKTFINAPNLDSTNIATSGVNTAQQAANDVTAAKIEAQQAWQSLVLTGFASVLPYYKDSLGIVHFRGDANVAASPGAGSTLGTLPAGYRPGTTQYFPLALVGGVATVYTISIDTAGLIKNIGAFGTASLSFGAVYFRAEN
jgi:hypothetical protein